MKSTAELMNGEDVLKILSEQAPVGACVMQDRRFRYLNSFFLSTTGYTADELVGKDSLEIVVPEDREIVGENTLRMLKGELLSPYQFRVTCRDNSVIWVMATVRSIQYRGRRATLGNYMEVTERRLMEQAVKESEEKYRELASSITDVFFALDEHLRYTYWNRASEALTGIRADDAVGRSLSEIFPDTSWRRRAEKVYRRVLRTQRPQTFVNDYDIDGRHYVLEINAYPSRGGVSVFVKDITEHKQTEDARREAEKEKSALLEEAPVSIIHTDLKGKIIYVNRRFESESGYSRGEVIGRNGFQLDWFPAGTLEFLTERMAARLRGSPAKHWETQFKCEDGHWIWIELEAKILERSGVSVGFQIIAANITERKQAEEVLRQSEERYRTILEETGDGYFETDLAGNFTFVNDAQAGLLGCSKKKIIGVNYRAFTPEGNAESISKAYKCMYKTSEPLINFPDEVIRKDGSHGFAETSAFPIRNDKGEIVGFRGVRRDITEHKQAEEALRRSEDRYRTILEEIEDSYFEVDLGGHFTFVNDSVCRNLGYSKEELIGMSYKNFTAEEDIESVFRVFNEVSQTGTPNKGFPWKVIQKDGIPRFAEASVSVLRDDRGEIIGFRGVGRDITERKRAEEALKLAAEEWRETFDSITDAISIHDRDNKILRANKACADIFHMKPSQLLGKHCYELHKEGKPLSDCPQKQTLATGKPAAAELYESNLGKYLLETTSPIFDKTGEVIGTVHITRDITEQKRQNEWLAMADRLASVGELAAGAAHELNNPLTSIIGFSQLLMEREIPNDIREHLQLINNEAQRAAGVTRNLLTFARKHAPVKEPSQINNIIEDVLKLRAHEHKVNCIEVKKRLAPDLPGVMVDYYQMQQVFLNTIINAEYSITKAHRKGTLTITTRKQNGTVKISIADDGPGIPQENLGRIFDPFFTTKAAGKGTGLGLSICHGIVAEHGGQIYAKSQPGTGATIVVELPINGSDNVEAML